MRVFFLHYFYCNFNDQLSSSFHRFVFCMLRYNKRNNIAIDNFKVVQSLQPMFWRQWTINCRGCFTCEWWLTQIFSRNGNRKNTWRFLCSSASHPLIIRLIICCIQVVPVRQSKVNVRLFCLIMYCYKRSSGEWTKKFRFVDRMYEPKASTVYSHEYKHKPFSHYRFISRGN